MVSGYHGNLLYFQRINGAMCVACAIYLRSPEGSIDVTACVCREGDSTCASQGRLKFCKVYIRNNCMQIKTTVVFIGSCMRYVFKPHADDSYFIPLLHDLIKNPLR